MRYVATVLALAAVLALGASAAAEGPATPAAPLKVLLISASAEYKSDESLAALQEHLEANYHVRCTRAFGADRGDTLPGLEALDTCDVVLVFARRVRLPEADLARVKAYFAAGRPVVGVRTASHAFQNWLEFDKEVLGGNYRGHYGAGPKAQVTVLDPARGHPVLAGVGPLASPYSLYKNTGLADDVTLLANATAGDKTEPVTWTRVHNGGRVFYTSLGGPEDFADAGFRRMLANALFWTTKRTPPAKAAAAEKP